MSKLKNVSIFGDMLAVAQSFFDAAHPIGEVYVQLPQQDAPEDLYNKNGIVSKWTILSQYDGAFFRSSNAPDAVYKADNEDQYYLYEDSKLIPTDIKSTTSGGPSVATTPSGSPIIIEGVTYKRYPVSNVTRYADNYINKTNVLNKQSQGTRKNGLSVSKSGNAYKTGSVYGNYQGVTSGGMSQHSSGSFGGDGYAGSSLFTTADGDTFTLSDGGHYQFDDGGGDGRASTVNMNISHTHDIYFTPSITDDIGVSDNISVSLGNGDIETRSSNYTERYWKRIS